MTIPVEGLPSPEQREPTSEEVQAVLDTIDMLLSVEGVPVPNFDGPLPKNLAEMMAGMTEDGVPFGDDPSHPPAVRLLPIGGLDKFEVRRYPKEAALHHRTVAQVIRRWPLTELGIDAERYEVLHIEEGLKGLHIIVEGTTRTDKEARSASEFFEDYDFRAETGMNKMTAAECLDLKDQLSSTTPMV